MLPWTPAMEQLRQQYANRIEELENDLQSQHYPSSSQNTPTTSLTPRTRWVSSGMHRNPPSEVRPATGVEGQQSGTSDRELQLAQEKLHFTERKLEQMEVPREDAPCTARGSRSACACRSGRSKPKRKLRR